MSYSNANYKKDNLAGLYKYNERKSTNYLNKDINKNNSLKNYSIKPCHTTYSNALKILQQENMNLKYENEELKKENYKLKNYIKKTFEVVKHLFNFPIDTFKNLVDNFINYFKNYDNEKGK